MSDAVKVGFVPFSAPSRGILVVFCDDTLKLGAATRKALGKASDTIKRAAATNAFKGKSASALDILAPEGIKAPRLLVIGTGKPTAFKARMVRTGADSGLMSQSSNLAASSPQRRRFLKA